MRTAYLRIRNMTIVYLMSYNTNTCHSYSLYCIYTYYCITSSLYTVLLDYQFSKFPSHS